MTLSYTPDDDIKVHEQGAIRLICSAYQTHEDGLPEWIKNAADEYMGNNAPPERRVIVVMLHSENKAFPASISVLDFSGMTSKVIEEDFRVWADPEASQRRRPKGKLGVQGGLGNGGKCYMVMVFDEHSVLHTVTAGKGCRYGVRGGTVQFGYVPDRKSGRNFAVTDLKSELITALSGIGVDFAALPEAARNAVATSKGFTLVTGTGPKGWHGRVPVSHVVQALRDHPQMRLSLEFCEVFVMHNGTVVPKASPLTLETILPDPAFADDRVIDIPAELIDPTTGDRVSTTDDGKEPAGTLTLKSSAVSMRWSRKFRHVINYRAKSGYIGYRPVLEFDINSPAKERIYGDCVLMSLEPMRQNRRAELANSPLTRAVEAFIATNVQEYAKEFEARDRREYDQVEKDELSKMNDALDRWKNQFMAQYLEGIWGAGGKKRGIPPPPPPPLPSGTPQAIEIALSHSYSGIGVAFRPALRFFDGKGDRIRPTPYKWISEDTNVAWVDDDLNVVTTFAPGHTEIWAQTLDGKVISNRVALDVVKIKSVQLSPLELQIPLGSRHAITAQCGLSNGQLSSDIYLVWFETEGTVAQVSASGQVFAHALGTTEVTAGDDKCMAEESVKVKVVEGSGGGDGQGHGYPRILISGVNKDPDTAMDVNYQNDDPPVVQRPEDANRNIWWINSTSPFADMYLGTRYGVKSREWRQYHVERVVEVMAQIALSSDPENEDLDINAWLLKWGEQQAAIRLAAAQSLDAFIAIGSLPDGQ